MKPFLIYNRNTPTAFQNRMKKICWLFKKNYTFVHVVHATCKSNPDNQIINHHISKWNISTQTNNSGNSYTQNSLHKCTFLKEKININLKYKWHEFSMHTYFYAVYLQVTNYRIVAVLRDIHMWNTENYFIRFYCLNQFIHRINQLC